MSRIHYDYINEIDALLQEKRAAADATRRANDALFNVKVAEEQLAKNEVLGGSREGSAMSATLGAGSPAPDNKDDADIEGQHSPQHGDRGSMGEAMAYQSGQPQSDSKDDAAHSGYNSKPEASAADKAANLGNEVLEILQRMAGQTQQDKQAAGRTMADQAIAEILGKVAQMPEELMDYAEGEEAGVPEGSTNKDETPGEGGEKDDEGSEAMDYSEEEKKEAADAGFTTPAGIDSYWMSKRAGAIAAVAVMQKLAQEQQELMAKQAGARVAEQMILQQRAEQEKAAEERIQKLVDEKVQEKLAAAQTASNTPNDDELVRYFTYLHQQEMAKRAAEAGLPPTNEAGPNFFVNRSVRVEPQQGNGSASLQKAAEEGSNAAEKIINQLAVEYLRKQADGGTGMASTILSGLVADGALTPEERDLVQNRLIQNIGMSGMTDELSIARATEGLANADVVNEALVKILMQHNDNKAPSPVPAMPATQESPSTDEATMSGSVSQSENPGGIEQVIQAALGLRRG